MINGIIVLSNVQESPENFTCFETIVNVKNHSEAEKTITYLLIKYYNRYNYPELVQSRYSPPPPFFSRNNKNKFRETKMYYVFVTDKKHRRFRFSYLFLLFRLKEGVVPETIPE